MSCSSKTSVYFSALDLTDQFDVDFKLLKQVEETKIQDDNISVEIQCPEKVIQETEILKIQNDLEENESNNRWSCIAAIKGKNKLKLMYFNFTVTFKLYVYKGQIIISPTFSKTFKVFSNLSNLNSFFSMLIPLIT